MPKCKLFENWTFRIRRPAPFDDPAFDGGVDHDQSMYNTVGAIHKATLHAPTLRALMAYARLRIAADSGQDVTGLGAIGHQGSNYIISEYRSAKKTDCVVFNTNTGKFTAATFEDGSDTPKPISLGAGNGTGSALLFCLMTKLEEDEEFRDAFEDFKGQMEAGWPDVNAAAAKALTLCDNVYRRIENARNMGPAAVRISVSATGNLSIIAPMALDAGTYSPTGVLYGDFTRLIPNCIGTAASPVIANDAFEGRFVLEPRTLTQRETVMVPKLEEWYIVPKSVVRICEHAKKTTGTAQPMRNFLLRGPAGTGKTMSAQAIAAGLHLPYTYLTCNANTEISDLVGQFIPDTEMDMDRACSAEPDGGLPKIADIVMHPPSVYKELTGVYDESKTEDDVLQKLIDVAVSRLMYKEQGSGQKIRYVESPLLEAIRYGYVCELQERATRS